MRKLSILLLTFMLLAATAWAGNVTISNSDSGWFDSTGFHQAGNTNYIAGNYFATYSDYFSFALTGLSGNITSAVFDVYTYTISAPGTYTIYATSLAPSAVLSSNSYSGATSIYNALTSGTAIGSITLSTSQSDQFVAIALNAAGLAFLQANEGNGIVIGGAYPNGAFAYTFGFSNFGLLAGNALNISTTPEPATLSLLGTGLFGLFGIGRRKLRKS